MKEINRTEESKDRNYSAKVVTSLSAIATFIGGFSFASLTVLLTGFKTSEYFEIAFGITALSTLLWVSLSVLGACLSIVSESIHLRQGSPLFRLATSFTFLTYLGIILFFTNIAIFSFIASTTLGIIVGGMAILTTILLFIAIGKVGNHWGR